MEEKQEGPEGKQTPGVTGATISPLMTGGCPVARALTSEKQGIESLLYHHVQYTFNLFPYKMDCQYCNACRKYYYSTSA